METTICGDLDQVEQEPLPQLSLQVAKLSLALGAQVGAAV